MHQEGVQPDARTFVGVLKACSSLASLEEGKQGEEQFAKAGIFAKTRAIHSQLVKSGFESDIFVGTTLVHIYVRCGSMQDAWCVFEDLPHHDVVTWSTMILGYAEQEESEEAFRLYSQMQEQGLSPNSSTLVTTLKACANAAALEIGKELHCQISRVGFETIAIVATGLIDMYGKCASMIDAQHLFDALPTRDAVTYTVLLAGYTRQGESELVFHLFEQMRQEGMQPCEFTFLSVLTVCSHVGLACKGHEYFQAMSNQYGSIPMTEHYYCMADLLGRAGRVDEAVANIENMPFQPDIVVWTTVLGAKLPAAYVLMSNLYV